MLFFFVLTVFVVVLALFRVAVATGKSVLGVETANGEAQGTLVAKEVRGTDAGALAVDVRVGHGAKRILLFLVFFLVFVVLVFVVFLFFVLIEVGETRDVVVIRFAHRGGDVPRPRFGAAIEEECALALVSTGATTQIDGAMDAGRAADGRNPLVDHIDHATDRARTVQQGPWATEHLDAFRLRRFAGHRVVCTDARCIATADAAFEGANAIAGQTTDDRATGAWSKECRVNAGLVGQRFAQARLQALFQLETTQTGCRRGEVKRVACVG